MDDAVTGLAGWARAHGVNRLRLNDYRDRWICNLGDRSRDVSSSARTLPWAIVSAQRLWCVDCAVDRCQKGLVRNEEGNSASDGSGSDAGRL